ncbi:hypothetical protein [Myceligenerans pegani]|uniref:Resolvase/invertase-type recombinase catalytic domain-containing protein n=1 Tax=Myceligenerans pegani TaxID=2776917 RepID=A0ABR9N6R6_9MICO|nr:hypothetical protein [Myceligenerans sp. TRM 65318]MBE1878859.1 hypothetical protein [Myceligenerans sp. TRM 65318]MBE3021130.1 hypothetical protein [Myceligenerans sp. TRM 65318]
MSQHSVAVGYARDTSQLAVVQAHARDHGYRLAHVIDDSRDAATISQLTKQAMDRGADVVILPGDAILSTARKRLEKELTSVGARCVVLGAPSAPARAALERVMPRRDFDATRGRHTKGAAQRTDA